MNKMDKKKVSVANFNVVFLDKDENEYPLLDYFDTILMPALRSGIVRKSGDSTYLIMDANIKGNEENGFVLTGLIVKSTILEVKSIFDEEGNLIQLDNSYPTAPFATFVIYLKNHRMVLVENQKGSPNIDNFRSTVKYVLDKYVNETNKELDGTKEALPNPLVNVVGISPKGGIFQALKKVEKVTRLTLRFYPLNGDGDIDFIGTMSGLTKEVRRLVGSKTGSVTYNSPKNIEGIIKVVEKSEGTVEPSLKVVYPGGNNESTLTVDSFSERRTMNVVENSREDELDSILVQSKEIESINYESQENNEIYQRNKSKIIKFVKGDNHLI